MTRSLARTGLAVAALLVLSLPARAQTVDEIVAKNLESKGGLQKLRDTSSVRLTGTTTLQGQTGPSVAIAKRPNLMRREITLNGQKLVQGYDGTTLWVSIAGSTAQEVPPGPQSDALKRSVEFDPTFLDWQQKGHTIELKGTVTEGGKELIHLVMTQKQGPALNYYLDATTGLEVRTVMTINDPAAKGEMEMRFSDYRTIDGRTIPFQTAQFLNGAQMALIRWEKIEFNVPFDDTIFRMPR